MRKANALNLDDIRRAAITLGCGVVRTPCVESRLLSELSGARIVLKLENLQYTASFKDRGALNKLSRLDDAERRRGVIAMSAGNHAQGVAYHARRLGIPATIVMPRGTPFNKVAHTRHFGAEVLLQGDSLAEATEFALREAATRNLAFVHPFDDPDIIAGQGTLALEMLEDVPDLDVLLVPVGGGGLIAGVATAAKALSPGIEIIGVEASLYPSMQQAIRGLPATSGGPSIAEGIAVKHPGHLTRAIAERLVDDFLTVDEVEMESAVQMLVEVEKTVAEGAGAAALAALFAHRVRFRGRKCGVIVSGGNIDSRLLASILMRGLARSGRLVRLRVGVPDLPGNLARVAQVIGAADGNIIEVQHQRLFHDVPVKMADLDLVVETRDAEHARQVAAALEAAGFPTRPLASTSVDPVAAAMAVRVGDDKPS